MACFAAPHRVAHKQHSVAVLSARVVIPISALVSSSTSIERQALLDRQLVNMSGEHEMQLIGWSHAVDGQDSRAG